MDLREYLRSEFNLNIRGLFIKDNCEKCGSNKELHLHHVKRFSELLEETLKELNLNELDTLEYSKEELSSIIHFMNSKQLKIKYKTLCSNCHNNLHHTKPVIKNVLTNKMYLTNKELAEYCKVSEKTINKWDNKLIELNIIEFEGYNYFCIDDKGNLFEVTEDIYKSKENDFYYYKIKRYKTNTENEIYINTINSIKNNNIIK